MTFVFSRAALLLLFLPLLASAQTPKSYSAADIALGLRKLNVLGSALYIAAHPDDENTRLIAYLANGRLLETGYLSCTRGDGGQNLVGPEIREGLGVIRTQELLAARRTDGGRQFFTRANDFGFSKTPEETFTIWDREQVLADMVWVIRQRRPDVLITRFSPQPSGTHGHHTASAQLALDAFDAAGDPKRFPEQLQYVQAWQPKRLFWNTSSFFIQPGQKFDATGKIVVDAGSYNALLGKSYGEIAATSRSQHKSQGFGSAATRGEAIEYLEPLKGEKAQKDLLEGVDLSWNRIKGGAPVGKLVSQAIKEFDPANPAASVAGLLKVREALLKAPDDGFWKKEKQEQVEQLIKACLGLYLEATAAEATTSPGQPVTVTVEAINRSAVPVTWVGTGLIAYQRDTTLNKPLVVNELNRVRLRFQVSSQVEASQPYWLRLPGTVGMYTVPEKLLVAESSSTALLGPVTGQRIVPAGGQKEPAALLINRQNLIGTPENPATAYVGCLLNVAGTPIFYSVPVQYKRTDPVEGELYRPLTVVPPVAVNIGGKAYVFADNQPKLVPVTVKAGRAGVRGTVALNLPPGWVAEPASLPFVLQNKEQEQTLEFRVRPTGTTESAGQLRAVATVDGQTYARGYQPIVYTHIPTQTLFPEAAAPLIKLDLKRKGNEIGYLMGAGDEVPDALRQIGYQVTTLKETDLTPANLRRFDAVLLGVRAYNTVNRLRFLQSVLLEYVQGGGNLIVQYTVNRGTVLPEIGPYPFKLSNDRVTVENAEVRFLKPQHPLLNTPNKITSRDFQGWVQEQGLYYPSQWDAKYQPIISSNDPGESPKDGAILVADYGKGHYIYTGLSFFRELPAGVPGAYRLLTNMISLGK
ncbi:hypothetical protein GCM10011375_24360 [Hymenobacter qilianensis]|uniref:Uncharacterized protein n=1 Tax=Hymenobacter qilianensis TaxID=1385715 RepID=A0ACB5PSS6_9BACT|nr:PIG-L family deacetylase [Hymenobacter qilianensis]GGF68469.1 hypothetical protein GCM10011375_24360 [Hymenobacter qilianensis]